MDNDTKLINLALDAGEIMLKNGAETFRVQDTMKRILSTTGREKIEATAISTALIVTLPREEKGPLSMMRGVRTRTINFEKVCEVNDMSRAFVSGKISVTEALDHCRNIYHAPNFKFRTRVFGYALSGACFAFMVGGSVQDFLVSFVIALLMGCTLVYLERKKIDVLRAATEDMAADDFDKDDMDGSFGSDGFDADDFDDLGDSDN